MQQQFCLSDSVASYNCSVFSLACFPGEGACRDFPAEWEWQGSTGQMTCEAALCSTAWRLQRGYLKGGIPSPEALVFVWGFVAAVVFSFVSCSSVYCVDTAGQHGSCSKIRCFSPSHSLGVKGNVIPLRWMQNLVCRAMSHLAWGIWASCSLPPPCFLTIHQSSYRFKCLGHIFG